jgi:hypothetical protein
MPNSGMRGKGITYDTGFLGAGTSTREPFDPEVVRREMRVIRDDLHCNAVRVTGGDPDRLEIAATHAADAGLEVWLCPFTNGLTQSELLELLADCAERAERLRRTGAEVVLLTGCELSLFTVGFLPGETLQERFALVADPLRVRPMIGEVRARINDFLRRAVEVVRARFGGKVSYASLPLEGVDWAPFDIISTDAAYRTAATARAVHAASATPTCRGSPRPHSPLWRTATAPNPNRRPEGRMDRDALAAGRGGASKVAVNKPKRNPSPFASGLRKTRYTSRNPDVGLSDVRSRDGGAVESVVGRINSLSPISGPVGESRCTSTFPPFA